MVLLHAAEVLTVICSRAQSLALRIKFCNQWGAFLVNDGLIGFTATIQAAWMDTSTQRSRTGCESENWIFSVWNQCVSDDTITAQVISIHDLRFAVEPFSWRPPPYPVQFAPINVVYSIFVTRNCHPKRHRYWLKTVIDINGFNLLKWQRLKLITISLLLSSDVINNDSSELQNRQRQLSPESRFRFLIRFI